MKTDILMNGSIIKNHISLKTVFEHNATRRTSFRSLYQACQIRLQDLIHQLQGHLQDRGVIAQHLLPARLHHLQKVILRLENERIELTVTSLQCKCQLRLMRDRGRTDIDATNRDISPVPVSNLVDDGSGQPDEIQAKKNPKTK